MDQRPSDADRHDAKRRSGGEAGPVSSQPLDALHTVGGDILLGSSRHPDHLDRDPVSFLVASGTFSGLIQ